MSTVFLALGSNVGDSGANIRRAVGLLATKIANIQEAPVYTSKAVGYTDQPDFLNTALRGETELSPFELLGFVKDIEQEVGRIHRFRWGPREIDIDIIFYDGQVLATPDLTIPHQRFAERDFVLRPICDIDDVWVDPVSHKSCRELLDTLPKSELAILD